MPQNSENFFLLNWIVENFIVVLRPVLKIGGILFTKGGINNMLIIDSKDCENIDKALKKYKKKFEKSRILLQLRERQSYTKPSIRRRSQVLKAVYRQQVASGKIEL